MKEIRHIKKVNITSSKEDSLSPKRNKTDVEKTRTTSHKRSTSRPITGPKEYIG